MPVLLGSLEIKKILDWDEEEVTTVPTKPVINRPVPTVEAEVFVREPRRIEITARLTTAEKLSFRNLKNQNAWQRLEEGQSAPYTLIDWVWIESVRPKWAIEDSVESPWLTTIGLICSAT